MGDLIRANMGAANSSLLSASFWYNSVLSPSILDCTGLFYSGHNLPSYEDGDYPSLQIYDNGTRNLGVAVGNPRGEEACKIEVVEGGSPEFPGNHGPIGEAGGVATMGNNGEQGYIYASYNSTGPATMGSGPAFDFFSNNLPQDGFTYFTGWGFYQGLNFPGAATSGAWALMRDQALAQLTIMSPSPAKTQFEAAVTALSAYVATLPTTFPEDQGPFNHGEASVSDVHKGAVYETYKPSQITFWNTRNNVCAPYGNWNHVALCIDTGHAGPAPNAPYFDQTNNVWVFSSLGSDLKRAKIRVNGVNAMDSDAPYQDGGNLTNFYTSSYSMDFSSMPIGIPYLHNARAALGQSPWNFAVRMYDLQVWCGTYIDWTDDSNFSKVVTISGGTGRPANQFAASAAFGTPTIRMHGDHLHFPTNHGTGGAYTKDGTITDFKPTPSY